MLTTPQPLTPQDLFGSSRVMAILRNMPAGHAVALAHRAWDLGVDLVEVPIQTPEFVPALEAVVTAGGERGKPVGAGTVTTIGQLSRAIAAGCAFTVAPGFDRAIVEDSRRLGIPHIPGVSTPSEIQAAVAAGCDWLKAFPASVLGTGWFRAMAGPFPNVRFIATGGIDASNAEEFLLAGARTVAIGSALEDPTQVDQLRSIA